MYLFFDTETTGLPKNYKAPASDVDNWPRLVQLAYLLYTKDGKLKAEGDFIIKPSGFDIPMEATKVHGISNEIANSEGISILDALDVFSCFLDIADLVIAHNISFDEKILGSEFIRNKMNNKMEDKNVFCTMLNTVNYCSIVGPYGFKWPKLQELHNRIFGVDFIEAHNASVDIKATAKCFWELKKTNIIKGV